MMLGPAMMLAAAGGLALLAGGGDAAIVYEGCTATNAPCCGNVDGLGNAFDSPAVDNYYTYSSGSLGMVNDYDLTAGWAEKAFDATCVASLATGPADTVIDSATCCGVQRTCSNYDGHHNNMPCPTGYAFDQSKQATASTSSADITADDATATGCCKRKTCGDIGTGVNFECPYTTHRSNQAKLGSTILSLENCCVPKTCGNFFGENQPVTCDEISGNARTDHNNVAMDVAWYVSNDGQALAAIQAPATTPANAHAEGEGCTLVFGHCSNPGFVVPASKLGFSIGNGVASWSDCCHERTCMDMDGDGTPAKCYHGPPNTVNNPLPTDHKDWLLDTTAGLKPVTNPQSTAPQWYTGWQDGGFAGGCCKQATCKDLYDDLLAPGAPHSIFTEYADAASAPGLNFMPGYGYNPFQDAWCNTNTVLTAAATGTTPATCTALNPAQEPTTWAPFNEWSCAYPQVCNNMNNGAGTSDLAFTCPAGRLTDTAAVASGIAATANGATLQAAVSDVVCCKDKTCDAVDDAGAKYVCSSPLSEKTAAFVAGAMANPSDANCCFTPTCGDFDGAGADFDCGKDDGKATGNAILGYTFKAGGEATVLNGADSASNRAQCCDVMTCSSAVGASGAALTCDATGLTAPSAYTGSLTLAAQSTATVTDGAFQLAGYVKDSAATALTSLDKASSDIQIVFNTDCCKLATCGDADGAGAPYNCAIKTAAADTFASETFFVNEASTQSNGMTFGVNSIEVTQAACCRTKVCADSDGVGTPFACPAGFVFNTANSGTQANEANGPLDQGLCCTADPNAGVTVATTVVTTAAVTTAAVTTAAVTTAAVTTAAVTTAAVTTAAVTTAAVTTAAVTTAAAAAAVNVEATDVFTGGCAGFTAAQQLQAMMDLATELGLDLGTIDFAQSTFQCDTARRSRRQASQTATIQFAVTGGAAAAAAAQSLVSAAASTTTAPAAKGKKAKAAKAAKMPKAAKGNKTAKVAKAAKMPKAKGNKTAKAAKAKAAKAAKGNKTAKASKAGKAAKAKAAKQMLQDQAEGGGATAASGMQTGLALLGGLLGVVGVAVGLRKRGAGGAGYAAVGDASVLEATEKSPLMATPTAYQRAPDGVEP